MACSALFHDACFLLAFFPVFLALYWASPALRWRHLVLVVGGLAFYSLWDARFAGLLVLAGLIDYGLAIGMERSARKARWLWASIGFNLGLLFVFKYLIFTVESTRSLLTALGVSWSMPYDSIVLPLGISFFTFKTMSYTIDVYRGEIPATRDPLKYLAFITLLADIVAGPIIRYKDMSQQLDTLPARLDRRAIALGVGIFALGLFKKVVVADSIAEWVDPYWRDDWLLTTATAWVAAIGYALQLYFDFSGYSDMAIGIGALLGMRIPENFRAPYQALNPSDFWRRWHISLSTWLRDYLYIPLGGNRGRGIRVHVNLLLVMVLGGLWHGAAWTFVAWGLYHGILLVLYKLVRPAWDAAPRVLQRATTLLLVVMGWVLFRARDMDHALLVYGTMFEPTRQVDLLQAMPLLAALGALLLATTLLRPSVERRFTSTRGQAVLAATLLTVSLVVALDRASSPFLYYQF